ncbi:hypothetical protein [Roseateles koreensis]|uniref:Uncharacterized protein n=1 Tax=Roseateles koreensis TaxID=2987526 RepID=A0ABT5KTQ6_9BURK|nr:hypothetical protein [Roseateles koreensis]MDC8786318.1 hypothetical protein [Roseateles koreensis]
MNSIEGTVARTESLSNEVSFFITYLDASNRLDRFRAVKDAFEHPPRRGESFAAIGHVAQSESAGVGFVAKKGHIIPPHTAAALRQLLAGQPQFSFLSNADIRSLEAASFDELTSWLGTNEVDRLVACGVSESAAGALCLQWQAYLEELRLMDETLGMKVSPRNLRTLVDMWPDASERVKANPYCLAPLVEWHRLDAKGRSASIAEDDVRRLRGAVTAAYFQDGTRYRWFFEKDELLSRLVSLVLERRLAEIAIEDSLQVQNLTLTRGKVDVYQDHAGMRLSNAAARHLSLRSARGARFTVASPRRRFHASSEAVADAPDAFHVFPSHRWAKATKASDWATWGDLFAEASDAKPRSRQTAVIHGTDGIDFCALLRILSRVSADRFTLMGAAHQAHPNSVMGCAVGPTRLKCWKAAGAEKAISSIPIPTREALIDEALFLYRTHELDGPTLILCQSAEDADELNKKLHLERVDYLKQQKQQFVQVQISRGQHATIGDPVRWNSSHLHLGANAGMTGQISKVFVTPEGIPGQARDYFLFTVGVDERNEVFVPASERKALELGYASTINDWHSDIWDCVIIVLEDWKSGKSCVDLAIGISTEKVICVFVGEEIPAEYFNEDERVEPEDNLEDSSNDTLGKEGKRTISVAS